MKSRLRLIVLFAIAVVTLRAAPCITIGALKLCLVSGPGASPDQLREYLPKSESGDHWSRRATVQVFGDLKDPEACLKQAAADIMRTGRFAHYEVLQDPRTKELILDFMTFPPDTDAEQYAEWGLMRARYVAGRGLVVCRYYLRSYVLGSAAATKVKAERSRMTEAFKAATFEEEAPTSPK